MVCNRDRAQVMGPRNRGAVERRWAARRTPVADIFRGRTRTRLHRAAHAAPHLHDVTDAVQPFFTLQLDIEVRLIPKCVYDSSKATQKLHGL